MKFHEYQGKEILKKFGVPVPIGKVAFSIWAEGRDSRLMCCNWTTQ